ncbi:MAG: cytochrome P450 [Solirubrobacterales bacterium]|nr:cytochrome P450 [Solirubrobacterales bacterium]
MATDQLSTIEFWSQPWEAREPLFAELRRNAPISWHEPPEDVLGVPAVEGDGYWAVVRYDDVRRISRDPRTFCSGQGVLFGDAPPEFLEATQSFLAMDAPRHTKLRGLVSSAFTPRQVRRIEDGIRANARKVVEEAAPAGGGDFVKLVAKRLPLMTISDMIGVPEADRERVVNTADVLVSLLDPEVLGDRVPVELLGEAIFTLHGFASELAAHREQHPGDDLMTALVQAEVDGEKLTHAEIAAFFVLLSVAGNDTTRHTTSHAMRALTTNPDARAYLLEDLEGRMPTAVEEFVRWATPVMTFRRTATRDVELHGTTVEAGQKVVMFYTSANRDEDAFADAHRFDVTRDPNHHVGFGGGGPHYCLGASLARTQLRSIFTELLTLLPDLEAGEPQLFPGGFINGVARMECSFTPRA